MAEGLRCFGSDFDSEAFFPALELGYTNSDECLHIIGKLQDAPDLAMAEAPEITISTTKNVELYDVSEPELARPDDLRENMIQGRAAEETRRQCPNDDAGTPILHSAGNYQSGMLIQVNSSLDQDF